MIFPEITDPVFRQAMELPPDDAVEQKVQSTIYTLQEKLGDPYNITIKAPTVTYDLKGTTAGMAVFDRLTKTGNIRINNALLYTDHYEDMIQDTVPHEVAHIVARQVYGNIKPHGKEWQYVMALLGLSATRCHDYDVTHSRTHIKFTYTCRCGPIHKVGSALHTKMQSGRHRTCKACRTRLHYTPDDA